MKLFHGSNQYIQSIDLSKSKPFKDFGQGFYLSADKGQAMRMAEQKTLLMMTGEPIVTEFDFDESLLQSGELSVKVFEDYSVEWATFILKNRDIHEKHPTHDYDIVFGPIADDGVAYLIGRYDEGTLTISELVRELEYKKLNRQYFFGTERAIKLLKRL